MNTGLSSGDLIGLISLLLGVIALVSWLFQRIGEARIKSTVLLREEVERSIADLQEAIETVERMQMLTSTTVERIVASLDLSTSHLEVLGGVIEDVLAADPEIGYPKYAKVHAEVVHRLRRANDELRILSPDENQRASAVKNLAFGSSGLRSLETVDTAIMLYPNDNALSEYSKRLRVHLRSKQ